MSKIKNMSRAGWIVTGVVVALVLVPTAAVAVTNAVIIKGSPSGNKADVMGASQLLTATANPSSFFQNGSQSLSTDGLTQVATPPVGFALVVNTIHVDVYSDPSAGSGQAVGFVVETGTTCSGSFVGSYGQDINPGTVGEIDVPLAPGLGIPSGDALCGTTAGGSVGADASVSGYTVPSGTVTSGPLHRVSPLPKQR